MKTILAIVTVLFIFAGIRCINVLDDIVTAIFCAGAAIFFFYGYLVWDNIKENERMN